jgi:NSS family neurotransmitter:Na+ symporter
MVDSEDNDIRLGAVFNVLVKYVIPVEVAALLIWWFTQAILVYDPERWWDPLRPFSVGTCVAQWGLLILVMLLLQKKITALLFPEGGRR